MQAMLANIIHRTAEKTYRKVPVPPPVPRTTQHLRISELKAPLNNGKQILKILQKPRIFPRLLIFLPAVCKVYEFQACFRRRMIGGLFILPSQCRSGVLHRIPSMNRQILRAGPEPSARPWPGKPSGRIRKGKPILQGCI